MILSTGCTAPCTSSRFLFSDETVYGRTKETADDWSHPEEPQLRDSPATDEHGNPRASRWVY
jgi:hypothetical protein